MNLNISFWDSIRDSHIKAQAPCDIKLRLCLQKIRQTKNQEKKTFKKISKFQNSRFYKRELNVPVNDRRDINIPVTT